MRDVFGADAAPSESSTSTAPSPAPAATTVVTVPAPSLVPAPAPGSTPPTLSQSVDKAVAKAESDVVVATDPNAVHHVKLAATAPMALGGGAAGAGIGFFCGGPVGAAVGGGIGYLAERYQVMGGPLTVILAKVKGLVKKV